MAGQGAIDPGQSDRPQAAALPTTLVGLPTIRPHADRQATKDPATVVDWLAGQGGRVRTSRRKLADVLGRRPTALRDELQRLATAGVIRMATSPRGTLLELMPIARPN